MVICLRDKLYRRGGHVAFSYRDEMFIWAGIVEHLPKVRKKIVIQLYSVKIDSITLSFCLHHYAQNGLSYLVKETRPTLCSKGRQTKPGISSHGTNKDHLSHRIQSFRTFTNLQYLYKISHWFLKYSFTIKLI